MVGITGITGILGIATVVLSLAAKMSLIDQIRINHQRHSAEGLSISFYAVATLSYLSFALLGAAIPDWWITIAQAPGVVLSLIVAGQWMRYHDRHDDDES